MVSSQAMRVGFATSTLPALLLGLRSLFAQTSRRTHVSATKINKRRRFAYPSILAITRERGQCECPRPSRFQTQQALEDVRRCDNAQHHCLFTYTTTWHETATRPVPQSQSYCTWSQSTDPELATAAPCQLISQHSGLKRGFR